MIRTGAHRNRYVAARMVKIFLDQRVSQIAPVRFTTPGEYSMSVAAQILERLENSENCEIEGKPSAWKPPGYGALVEKGVRVKLDNIEFIIMCSYEDIIIERISGNKAKFYQFCESIREMDFDTT